MTHPDHLALRHRAMEELEPASPRFRGTDGLVSRPALSIVSVVGLPPSDLHSVGMKAISAALGGRGHLSFARIGAPSVPAPPPVAGSSRAGAVGAGGSSEHFQGTSLVRRTARGRRPGRRMFYTGASGSTAKGRRRELPLPWHSGSSKAQAPRQPLRSGSARPFLSSLHQQPHLTLHPHRESN